MLICRNAEGIHGQKRARSRGLDQNPGYLTKANFTYGVNVHN